MRRRHRQMGPHLLQHYPCTATSVQLVLALPEGTLTFIHPSRVCARTCAHRQTLPMYLPSPLLILPLAFQVIFLSCPSFALPPYRLCRTPRPWKRRHSRNRRQYNQASLSSSTLCVSFHRTSSQGGEGRTARYRLYDPLRNGRPARCSV